MRSIKRKLAAFGAAAVMLAAGTTMSASAISKDYSVEKSNDYLRSIQTTSYDPDTKEASAKNLTICRKDNYTAIYSCAEIRTSKGATLNNSTDFKPSADVGTICVAKTTYKQSDKYVYAYYRSFVRDEDGNNRGEMKVTRRYSF